jgi:hypothetical protein
MRSDHPIIIRTSDHYHHHHRHHHHHHLAEKKLSIENIMLTPGAPIPAVLTGPMEDSLLLTEDSPCSPASRFNGVVLSTYNCEVA